MYIRNTNEIEEIEYLLEYVRIDCDNGKIYWTKRPANAVNIGDEAGTKEKDGYTRITFKGKRYARHRIIFYHVHGYLPEMIDHVNGVECGDGITNLQEITNQGNQNKAKLHRDSRTGFKGVSYHKRSEKYVARIVINGKAKHLGMFETPEEASEAYNNAKNS